MDKLEQEFLNAIVSCQFRHAGVLKISFDSALNSITRCHGKVPIYFSSQLF